jgi:hypothetical protein
MESFIIVLQLLILIGMIAAWWGARRDLINIATAQQTPTLEKIEQLRASVDALLDELDQKVAEIEDRIVAVSALPVKEPEIKSPVQKAAKKIEAPASEPKRIPFSDNGLMPIPHTAETRYDEVYTLSDAGVDVEDIARRTGLGSAEVEMVISLRPTPREL